MNQRVQEILEWAAEEGITLPRSAEEIVRLENAGHVVDLVTGEILWGAENDTFNLTVGGEANGVIWQFEDLSAV